MIGVIADDLTGAAEIGAIAVRFGLTAEILHATGGQGVLEFRVHPAGGEGAGKARTPDKSGRAAVLCLNTDSRSRSPSVAGRRAAAAAKALAAAGAEWIYKKTDSVLRGPVAAELEAILKALGLRLALLVPANPSLGRTIRGGRYFIHGRPIHKTEFARDPEHPRRSADVRELLGRAVAGRVGVCGVRDLLPADGIGVGEAESTADLRRWAARRNDRTLCAGGGEFFATLLAATGHSAERRRSGGASVRVPQRGSGSLAPPAELFICGSTSESARRFVAENRKRDVPVFALPAELARGGSFKRVALRELVERILAALPSHRRVILSIGLPPVRDRRIARRLADALARLAAAVLRRAAVPRVYAEGGATAMALLRAAGWKRLNVLREATQGVATLAVEDGKVLLTIKPGSYVWPREIRHPG